jgi:type II secretory pathway pseudopilin PulG
MTDLSYKLVANHCRRGLTLIELVVVLLILMSLAAIVIPLFPSMVERAHRASQATNESEVTKAVQLYQGLYGNYPDGFDLLTDGTNIINYFPAVGTASPMLFGEAPGTMGSNVYNQGWTFPAGGYVTAAPLTAKGLNALNGAGIVAEYTLLNGATLAGNAAVNAGYAGSLAWTPTFNPYTGDTPTVTPLATGTAVVYVLPSGIQVAGLGNPSIINPKSTTQFVLFGVGKRSAMVGTVMSNAPSNFPNDAVHENPNVVYQRFGVVFQVEDALGNGLPAAVFLGAVAIESNILLATDGTLNSYYQNIPAVSAPASGPGE